MKHGLRAMAAHCAECTDAPADAREEARSVLAPKRSKMKPKSKRGARVARHAKKASKSTMRREVRAVVMGRAAGQCEVQRVGAGSLARRCESPAEEWDHFFGRGKDETVAGSWGICKLHHDDKGAGYPSRIWWLESFVLHCNLRGYLARTAEEKTAYAERASKCESLAQLEAAQHPSLTPETETTT